MERIKNGIYNFPGLFLFNIFDIFNIDQFSVKLTPGNKTCLDGHVGPMILHH